jgi:hypothetical protein
VSKKTNPIGLTFVAAFHKATTTVDGGWRISFDVSEDEAKTVAQLSVLRGELLQLAVIPIPEDA